MEVHIPFAVSCVVVPPSVVLLRMISVVLFEQAVAVGAESNSFYDFDFDFDFDFNMLLFDNNNKHTDRIVCGQKAKTRETRFGRPREFAKA